MGSKRLVVCLLASVLITLAATSAEAIPAFARKYKFSCTTCHDPFPRLKPYGEEFAGRGFRMEDPSQEPSRATYDVGDPLLELMRTVPLAIRLDGYTSYKEDAAAESDFEFPWAFKILSGGPISKKISYYFYYILEKGESGKLEDAYVQFNSPFGLPVDLMFGQFQISDPLFKRELRLERSDYLIYKAKVGLSHVDLTYDRGIMLLWAFPGEIDAVLQVVNGNGIEEAERSNFDNDSNKDVGFKLNRSFGPVRVGIYGYWGKEEGRYDRTNKTTYIGPDMTIDFGEKFQLNLQYLQRTDDNPYFSRYVGYDWETKGGFAELLYFPMGADGRLAVAGLYNKVESDAQAAVMESVSLTVNYLLARNGKLMVEAERDLEHDLSRLSVGFVTAF